MYSPQVASRSIGGGFYFAVMTVINCLQSLLWLLELCILNQSFQTAVFTGCIFDINDHPKPRHQDLLHGISCIWLRNASAVDVMCISINISQPLICAISYLRNNGHHPGDAGLGTLVCLLLRCLRFSSTIRSRIFLDAFIAG